MTAASKAFFVFMIGLQQGGGIAVLCGDQGPLRRLKGLADVLNRSEISPKPARSPRSRRRAVLVRPITGAGRPYRRSGRSLRRRLDVGVEPEQVQRVVTVLDRDETVV